MQLTRLAVYRPVIALTVTLALLLFGVLSYFSLGLEDNPQLKLPIVTVTAVYPGASAETVEDQVTRRIEDAISSWAASRRSARPRRPASRRSSSSSTRASTSTSPPATSSRR